MSNEHNTRELEDEIVTAAATEVDVALAQQDRRGRHRVTAHLPRRAAEGEETAEDAALLEQFA